MHGGEAGGCAQCHSDRHKKVALLYRGQGADGVKSQPSATCVFQEPDLIERTIRDFLTEDVERVVVDHPPACERMRVMVEKISPRSSKKVKLYNEPQPIFDRFNITRQLETTFTRQVMLTSGG